MKVASCIALASLVQSGLAWGIPAFEHSKFHNPKRNPEPQVFETVTTTLYQTIVWVDGNGAPVSTEINNFAADTVAASTLGSPPPGATDGNPPNLGAKRPQLSDPQISRATPASQPPSPAAQPPQQSQASSAAPQQDTDSGNASGGSTQGGSTAPGGMGICYDAIDSQTKCKDKGTIGSEFSFLKSQGYSIVRIYDIGCPVGDYIDVASQNGLKLMVGINTIANLEGDLAQLVGMVSGNWGPIDTVYIGNELVNHGAASAYQVAGAVSTAKGILSGVGFSGSVVTVDTFAVMQNDPIICSTSDYCAANAHAYFDPNTAAANAGSFVLNAYNRVASANGGKKVIITESGWPYQGNCNGQACPSVENQKAAMHSLMDSFKGMPGNIYMFQAYNAGYKQPGSLGVEQWFGIYDTDHYTGGIGPS